MSPIFGFVSSSGLRVFGLASLGVVRGVVADRNGLSGAEEVTGDVGVRFFIGGESFLG